MTGAGVPSRGVVVDLCCGGGGASVGYWLAGFDVLGVDVVAQPHYPFDLVRGDVLAAGVLESVVERAARRGGSVIVVHASPPCQRWSRMTPAARRASHPDLVAPLRRRLSALARAGAVAGWVIENVPGAPLGGGAVQVCGGGLGLGVRRHRLFESSEALWGVPCSHVVEGVPSVVGGYGGPGFGRRYVTARQGREAMGVDWLPWPALVQSIPPAYTEHLGRQLAERFGVTQADRSLAELRPRCRCGGELRAPFTGRWPLHCCQACRQAAYAGRVRAGQVVASRP